MSTDPNSEATSDDSGGAAPAPRVDWPKKIRTLSAAELDRLTIDGEGRFYWDGHLVNYQPPQQPQAQAPEARATQPVDVDALALLDRAALELSGQPAPAAATDTTASADTTATPEMPPQPAVDEIRPPGSPAAPVSAVTAVTVTEVPHIAPMPMFDVSPRAAAEKVRLRMSFWQSLALLLATIGLLIGAAGIAISGLVAAHEWGCRTNLVKQFCPPPPPAPKPPTRTDIPA